MEFFLRFGFHLLPSSRRRVVPCRGGSHNPVDRKLQKPKTIKKKKTKIVTRRYYNALVFSRGLDRTAGISARAGRRLGPFPDLDTELLVGLLDGGIIIEQRV